MRIALVSREIAPFSGGGIAPAVRAVGELLAEAGHEVTIVTADDHENEYHERLAGNDPDLTGSGVRWAFVERPPEDGGAFLGFPHAWSASVHRTLRRAYGDDPPDLIEFADYLGEGFATVQARHTNDPWLARTTVAVRIHTTSEICAVLDGALPDDHDAQALFELERYCLQHADRITYQGGDIYRTYERFYGKDALAPGVRIPAVVPDHVRASVAAPANQPSAGEPLHVLYLGRLERRKGVHDLAAAIERVTGDVRLQLVGGDTDTGPLAASIEEQLGYVVEGDPRVELVGSVDRDQVAAVISEADLVVVPSRWECWPNVVLEALAANRPVLATPVGGLIEMVGDGGWIADATGPEALARAIDALAADPDAVRALSRAMMPRERFEHLVEPDRVRDGYTRLAETRSSVTSELTPARRAQPLVSIVVPYFELDGTLEATLASIATQDYEAIETIVVNDGSLRKADDGLWDLAARYGARVVTQPNAGLSAARNLGIATALGDYVLPLDADDEIAPSFVSRCVLALEHDRDLAYVTSWVRYIDEQSEPRGDRHTGYFPFGNWSSLMSELNVAGTCSAVFRRSVFRDHRLRYGVELASYEDWGLYRQMARIGLFGAVIPEPLFWYRVRASSMTRQDAQPNLARLLAELRAHDVNGTTRWEAQRG